MVSDPEGLTPQARVLAAGIGNCDSCCMCTERDSGAAMCDDARASEMRSAVVLEPRLSTGAGGRSPTVSPGMVDRSSKRQEGARMRRSRVTPVRHGDTACQASNGPAADRAGRQSRPTNAGGVIDRPIGLDPTPCSSSPLSNPRAGSRCEAKGVSRMRRRPRQWFGKQTMRWGQPPRAIVRFNHARRGEGSDPICAAAKKDRPGEGGRGDQRGEEAARRGERSVGGTALEGPRGGVI